MNIKSNITLFIITVFSSITSMFIYDYYRDYKDKLIYERRINFNIKKQKDADLYQSSYLSIANYIEDLDINSSINDEKYKIKSYFDIFNDYKYCLNLEDVVLVKQCSNYKDEISLKIHNLESDIRNKSIIDDIKNKINSQKISLLKEIEEFDEFYFESINIIKEKIGK